ncbi:STAS domain-containing protein [Polaromonas sp.]|uniref:STAS domain-containing protein n=1 Tax=Polaromonas sp. TaxID=1869339 RepID=UPI0017F14960|nr:STAS domain-containing protein [Polaromonas sp.]NMM06512.1 STAS domain-containing protein [Polaromonas sp.]
MLTLPAVLTHAASAQFALGLKQAVASQPAQLVADANGLHEFDSSALALLLACRREALAGGKAFSVQGLPARLRQLAGLYGVAELIPDSAAVPA